jgi:hypothetical protein
VVEVDQAPDAAKAKERAVEERSKPPSKEFELTKALHSIK